MTRAEFTKKWAKKVTGRSAIEEFERDVESMAYATARSVIAGVTRAIKKVRRIPMSREAKVLSMVADNLLPAVERAFIEFYNGPETKK